MSEGNNSTELIARLRCGAAAAEKNAAEMRRRRLELLELLEAARAGAGIGPAERDELTARLADRLRGAGRLCPGCGEPLASRTHGPDCLAGDR